MAKAVAKSKKTVAKSKPSAKAKTAPPPSARKALKKAAAKPAAKPAVKAAVKKAAVKKPAPETLKSGKWVYTFGDGKAEGKAGLRDLLGGKGANLAEMANLGLPVPSGLHDPDFGLHLLLCARQILSGGAEGAGREGARSCRQDRRQVVR